MRTASALERRFNTRRVPMRGRARAMRPGATAVKSQRAAETGEILSFLFPAPPGSRRKEPRGGKRAKDSREKRVAANSPMRWPYTARRTVMGCPCSVRMSAMRNTAPMRTACSASWVNAGTFVRCRP